MAFPAAAAAAPVGRRASSNRSLALHLATSLPLCPSPSPLPARLAPRPSLFGKTHPAAGAAPQLERDHRVRQRAVPWRRTVRPRSWCRDMGS